MSEAYLLPLVVKRSLWRSIVPLFGSVIVAVIAGYALAEGKTSWFVWTVFGFFGASAFFYLGQCQFEKPRLTISAAGICVEHWRSGTMFWGDFSGAFLNTSGGAHYLCLTLRDPEEYRRNSNALLRAIHTANRETGHGDIAVKLDGMGLDAGEVLSLVRQQIGAAKTKPKSSDTSFKYNGIS